MIKFYSANREYTERLKDEVFATGFLWGTGFVVLMMLLKTLFF